jgi:hypothetical protein
MRTSLLSGVVMACAAAACSRSSSAVVQSAAASAPVPAAFLPPATDLTGTWATGTGAEPTLEKVTLHPGCQYNPPVWIIQQTGNVLEAWDFPESFNQGIAVKGPGLARIAASPGRISGSEVTIDDGRYRYVLRYDEASKHLRGTRNGSPFWAVRQAVVRTEACPGVP